VQFHALKPGKRKSKFDELAILSLDGAGWQDCPNGWRAPFLPEAATLWGNLPYMESLFSYNGSGVMPGRTWVIAPDKETLKNRWTALISQKDATKREELFHPHLRKGATGDKHLNKPLADGLLGHEFRKEPVAKDTKPAIAPSRYGYRTLDRQWIIPDGRLINQSNPRLWRDYSERQLFITAPEDRAITSGPALSIAGLMPDLHHYHGRGGRVYPLYADAKAEHSNISQALLDVLAEAYGAMPSAEDVFAYIAAVLAHPAFTARFKIDLKQPGLRVPFTADAALFTEAAAIGREMVWLHTYGERFQDAAAGRPKGAPRLPQGRWPQFVPGKPIPPAPEPLPDVMDYDPATQRLKIGKGEIGNVTPAMRDYEVSGKNVLTQWFSYRRRDRTKPVIGDRRPPSPLEKIQPDGWLHEYTTDLLDLLHVLGRVIELEPRQADLLSRICDGALIPKQAFVAAGLAEKPSEQDDEAE
jgi:Type ISP C-terminal specificity domain